MFDIIELQMKLMRAQGLRDDVGGAESKKYKIRTARVQQQQQQLNQLPEIRRLRTLGVNIQEIMRMMNISRHCYEDRVLRINQIDQEYIMNRFHNEIASEIITLQERLSSTIRICEEIATNEHIEAQHRIDALELKVWCAIGLVKVLQEGPNVLKNYLGDSIISKRTKLESIVHKTDLFDADHPPPPDFDTSDWRYG